MVRKERNSLRKVNLKNIILFIIFILAVLLILYMVFYQSKKVSLSPPYNPVNIKSITNEGSEECKIVCKKESDGKMRWNLDKPCKLNYICDLEGLINTGFFCKLNDEMKGKCIIKK